MESRAAWLERYPLAPAGLSRSPPAPHAFGSHRGYSGGSPSGFGSGSRGFGDSPSGFGSGSRGFGGPRRHRGAGSRRPQSFSPSNLQVKSRGDASVEKYFSPSMMQDPWEALQTDG
ncbi:M-phase-specific PLK1-interacting protein [Pseudoliparis swirei]|uniref:M-phase-specific PLK1-interacting protein n=1 Tax=Pseudoliparis swirei TaxID=2059687 RepID=UPI0024BECCF8|nr:M-phase-specific PLK1-interacting protein [Pseudoliparis swirei]